MAWTKAQVLAWLDEVEPRADGRSHFDWLELPPTASPRPVQDAFHTVARSRHPDLFRTSLSERDFDRLTRMYAKVANAYAELRGPTGAADYLRKRRDSGAPVVTEPAPPPAASPIDPAKAMNARALAFYRRAEGALRTGNRATAVLNIKAAIAADPASALLRAALAELTQP
ncbi:MAG: hypothetical protein R3B06_26200 [Kofleriaceae bacterium]